MKLNVDTTELANKLLNDGVKTGRINQNVADVIIGVYELLNKVYPSGNAAAKDIVDSLGSIVSAAIGSMNEEEAMAAMERLYSDAAYANTLYAMRSKYGKDAFKQMLNGKTDSDFDKFVGDFLMDKIKNKVK